MDCLFHFWVREVHTKVPTRAGTGIGARPACRAVSHSYYNSVAQWLEPFQGYTTAKKTGLWSREGFFIRYEIKMSDGLTHSHTSTYNLTHSTHSIVTEGNKFREIDNPTLLKKTLLGLYARYLRFGFVGFVKAIEY